MSRTWLILDCNFICHRAHYAIGDLTGKSGRPIGVLFGFFREIETLCDLFCSTDVLFSFDDTDSESKRTALFPDYKLSRRLEWEKSSGEEREKRICFREQVHALRSEYLPTIGYRNVFYEPGYESDDIMASLSLSLPEEDKKVIITADQDLFQCLRKRVRCYNPNKRETYTEGKFKETYGIDPDQWPDVKALAGCHSDGVPGIRGIGELTALRYLRGELKQSLASYKKIHSKDGHRAWKNNLKLVRLPFSDTPVYTPKTDKVSSDKWNAVMGDLGFRSMVGRAPTLRNYGE